MQLEDLGTKLDIDITGALARFSGVKPLYVKYLKRFAVDPTFTAYEAAVSSQDPKGLEESAHALKGICGNLGLTSLYQAYSRQVALVRAGDCAAAFSEADAVIHAARQCRQLLAELA